MTALLYGLVILAVAAASVLIIVLLSWTVARHDDEVLVDSEARAWLTEIRRRPGGACASCCRRNDARARDGGT